MKRTMTTLALAAILAGTSHAAISGRKPAFMDRQQLAAMRNSASSTSSANENPTFFTGKPYLTSSDEYTFKYRSYRTGIARWTTDDPSGFPDGANAGFYAPNPLWELDPNGLQATLAFDNHIHTISLSIYVYDSSSQVTAMLLGLWKNAIESAWSFTGTDKSNGQSLEMKTSVTFGLHGTGTYNRAEALNQYDNVVEMTNHSNVDSHVTANRIGTFQNGLSDKVVVH